MSDDALAGIELVPRHDLLAEPVEAWFPLRPGERPLVAPGEAVVRGAQLAELRRELRTEVLSGSPGEEAEPGMTWEAGPGGRRLPDGSDRGELLFRSRNRWRVGTGDPADPLEAPMAGIVRDVKPGAGLTLRSPARAILGTDVLAGPSSGRLQVLAARSGHLRASEIDVGSSGAIIVAGMHIDAEAITRARAVGVRGIVVAGLGVTERREVTASERRGRAGVHGLPPFAILVLEGAIGRPIASPVMAMLEAIEGRSVAIIGRPAGLVIEDADVHLPAPRPGHVRVVAGPLAGTEGRWAGLAGPRAFEGGVVLEAGFVAMAGRPPIAVPLGDLERFA
jgi:hypothetical protein